MAHTTRDKRKVLLRIRRIRGQLDAVERAVDAERDCSEVLQTLAACRGALNGLLGEILEGHIRSHVLDPESRPARAQVQAADELIEVLKRYLK